MTWLATWLHYTKRLARRAWQRVCEWVVPPYRTAAVEGNLPSRLERRTLYVVEEDGYREQAAMICPCGCGKVLHMNLLTDERPYWQVTLHEDGSASLHPSVWRKKDCGSHFWFKRGRVTWCRS